MCPLKTGHLGQWPGHWRQRLARELGWGEAEQSQVTNLWIQSTGKRAQASFNRKRKKND